MFNKKEYMKEYSKKYYIKNKEKLLKGKKEYFKKWYIENRERLLNKSKEYYINNREKKLEKNKIWRKNNPEYIKEYYKNKYRTDIKYGINHKMRKAIGESLKGNKNGRHWEDLVGYTLNDLIKRLKGTLPKGYTWQDYLEGKLHIDHIIPKSIFNFDNSNQINFKRCWALENLQLLPASENLIKNNKLTKPFQIALKM